MAEPFISAPSGAPPAKDEVEGSDRITFACDLCGRYNPYPMVEPVGRETKFC
jgi:hypothetical protein